MALEVIGRLHEVHPTQQIKDNFSKREFIIEISEETASGMVYSNYASFQLVNNSCSVIDQFQPGEQIKVSFNIRGNRWEKDGVVRYITNLNAWRVERANVAAGVPQQAAAPPPPPPQQSQAAPFANNPNTNNSDGGDLPF